MYIKDVIDNFRKTYLTAEDNRYHLWIKETIYVLKFILIKFYFK